MNDSSSKAEDDPKSKFALSWRGFALGTGESFLVGLSYFLGFVIADKLGLSRSIPTISITELILLSLGALFAYAFVFAFRKNHQSNFQNKAKFQALATIENISLAYILHLAILFLVKDQGFSSVRAAIGMAYLIGGMGILGFRFLIRSLGPNPAREGKKRIIFKGTEIPALASIARSQPNRLKSYVLNSVPDDNLEEKTVEGAPVKR